MDARSISYDGPRSTEAITASSRAGRDRILPLVQAHPDLAVDLLGGLRAVAPDGAEFIIHPAAEESALDELARVISTSELLRVEDPALRTGLDRLAPFVVTDVLSPLADSLPSVPR